MATKENTVSTNEFDQAIRKLSYAWDKEMEYIRDNQDAIAKRISKSVDRNSKELESYLQDNYKDVQKRMAVTGQVIKDEIDRVGKYLRTDAANDVSANVDELAKDYQRGYEEWRDRMRARIKVEELKYDAKQVSDRIALKQQEASMKFNAALQSMKDALDSFGESVDLRTQEIKDSMQGGEKEKKDQTSKPA